MAFNLGQRQVDAAYSSSQSLFFPKDYHPPMASPFISERVRAAILRSLCSETGKDHGKRVVSCMEGLREIRVQGEEEVVLSFADLVDEAGYIARGMLDDFFPRYPYKTSRKAWGHFKTWVTEGTGLAYQNLCVEWIELAQKFLRECSDCRSKSRKPTKTQLQEVFGPYQPYYVGDRPEYMYVDDDLAIVEFDLTPVVGGLVNEEAGADVKVEMDYPPGFMPVIADRVYEAGGTSTAMSMLGSNSGREELAGAATGAVVQGWGDPMMLDPVVKQMLGETDVVAAKSRYP